MSSESYIITSWYLFAIVLHRKEIWWIYLPSKLKGESITYIHKQRSVAITGTGIDIKTWRDRLSKVFKLAEQVDNPVITNSKVYVLSYVDMNELIWDVLEEIYLVENSNFPQAIMCIDNIKFKTNNNQTIWYIIDIQMV